MTWNEKKKWLIPQGYFLLETIKWQKSTALIYFCVWVNFFPYAMDSNFTLCQILLLSPHDSKEIGNR